MVKDGQVVASGRPEEVLTEETIGRIYEVEAEVCRDSRGALRVLYHPGGGSGRLTKPKKSTIMSLEQSKQIRGGEVGCDPLASPLL